MNYMLLMVWILFALGLAFVCKPVQTKEGLSSPGGPSCPNLLLVRNGLYYLYNTQKARVPGVNPAIFESLEDYKLYIDWQKAIGLRCPVLHLESGYSAQGQEHVKVMMGEGSGGSTSYWPEGPTQVSHSGITTYNKGDYPSSSENVIGSQIQN